MAKCCGTIARLIVIVLFNFIEIKSIELKQTEYSIINAKNNLAEKQPTLLYVQSQRQKRQTIEFKNVTDSINSTSLKTKLDNLYPTTQEHKSIDMIDIKTEPPGITDIQLNQSQSVSTSTLSPILFGANGTGQRKYYPPPIQLKPAVVSEPISPTYKSIKLSSRKKGYSLNTEASTIEEIIDGIDRPDNETTQQKELAKHNITKPPEEDYHIYYNSKIIVDSELTNSYWKTFQNITPNTMLSTSHRRAMTVQLSFDFPFYGHPVRNVTVATGGFLYTGEYVHSWLAATQYIAPLMANFDTSLSNDSYVRFLDNGTSFTVVWENVFLQDKQEVGSFSFSTTLHSSGDIVFAYYSVPILIETIKDDKHPVKVGLSDAYITDKIIFFARRKTIYEYHRVNFGSQDIRNYTVIYLSAQPTCLGFNDCASCLTQSANFKCFWCPTLNKCSTGTDRRRQDWLHKGCDRTQITNISICPAIGEKGNNAANSKNEYNSSSDINGHVNKWLNHGTSINSMEHNEHIDTSVIKTYDKSKMESSKAENDSSGIGMVLGFMLPICFIISALLWVLYAYRNPHTKSGQLLIQYRPSQWTWRRGEARYTAATIHM